MLLQDNVGSHQRVIKRYLRVMHHFLLIYLVTSVVTVVVQFEFSSGENSCEQEQCENTLWATPNTLNDCDIEHILDKRSLYSFFIKSSESDCEPSDSGESDCGESEESGSCSGNSSSEDSDSESCSG